MSNSGNRPDFLSDVPGVTVKASLSKGSKILVDAAKLKPYFDFHGRTTDKEQVTVEILQMGAGTTDLDENKIQLIVMEIILVDNNDPIDGLTMFVGFGDVVTIK